MNIFLLILSTEWLLLPITMTNVRNVDYILLIMKKKKNDIKDCSSAYLGTEANDIVHEKLFLL